MPVDRIRKRYLLFRWQKDEFVPSWVELEKFLSSFNDEAEGGGAKQLTRLMILDSQACMGIIKTRHTLVLRLKTQLTEACEKYNLHKFQVIAVSGTVKKLKLQLFAAKPN